MMKLGEGKSSAVFDEPCFSQMRRDPADRSSFDVIWLGLGYDCENRTFELAVYTDAAWRESNFSELDWFVKIDDSSTGCSGDDAAVYLYRDPVDHVFYGGMFRIPDCNPDHWHHVSIAGSYWISGRSGFVAHLFPATVLGGSGSFAWWGVLVGTTARPDLFPNSGYYAADGWNSMGRGGGFSVASTTSVASGYDMVVPGDFDGDGIGDALFYARGASPEMLRLGRWGGRMHSVSPPSINGSFELATANDFNGDGYDDLLLYGRGTKGDVMRFGGPDGRFSNGPNADVDATFDSVVSGQFDRDWNADVVFYRSGTTSLTLRRGNGRGGFGAVTVIRLPRALDDVAAGDFNSDGYDDLLLYKSGPGPDRLLLGNAPGSFTTGPAVDVDGVYDDIVSGDFDGNFRSDVLLYGQGGGADGLRYSRRTGALQGMRSVDQPCTCVPAVGDFNGDGRRDVLWYNPSGPDSIWFGKPQ